MLQRYLITSNTPVRACLEAFRGYIDIRFEIPFWQRVIVAGGILYCTGDAHRNLVPPTSALIIEKNTSTPSLIDLHPRKVIEIKKLLEDKVEQYTI